MAKNDTVVEATPMVALTGEALVNYAQLQVPIDTLKAEITAAEVVFESTVAPKRESLSAMQAEADGYIASIGIDPLNLGTVVAKSKGVRGKSDPRRGEAVRAAMNGTRGPKDIVKAANEALSSTDASPVDNGFVQAQITGLKKGNKWGSVKIDGEKGSFTYKFVPKA